MAKGPGDFFPGGFTWVDIKYDKRVRELLGAPIAGRVGKGKVEERWEHIAAALRAAKATGELKDSATVKEKRRIVLRRLGYKDVPRGFSEDTIRRVWEAL
jgi:hypothetical protein